MKPKDFLDRLISMVSGKGKSGAKEAGQEAQGQVMFSAYVPSPIADPKHPSLAVFPQNILFRNQKSHRFHALYVPDPRTFLAAKSELKLTYHNIRDQEAKAVITFKKEQNLWTAEKFYKQEFLGSAQGADWNGFFFQLGILGADVREKMGTIDVQDVVRGGTFSGNNSKTVN